MTHFEVEKMVGVKLVILAVLLGVANGDVLCTRRISSECITKLNMPATPDASKLCEVYPTFMECLSNGMRQCGSAEAEIHDFDKLTQLIVEICEDGSDLNTGIERHGECMAKSFSQKGPECVSDIMKMIEKLKNKVPNEEDFINVLKEACYQKDRIMGCVFRNIRSDCSEDAERLARKINEPMQPIESRFCNEIGAASGFYVNSALMVAALVLLLFKQRL